MAKLTIFTIFVRHAVQARVCVNGIAPEADHVDSGIGQDPLLGRRWSSWLRRFWLLVGWGRTPAPARCWRDRSVNRLVGTDGHAIHQRIEAQVQLAGVATIDLSRIGPL